MKKAPLYCVYSNQSEPQSAHVAIDLEQKDPKLAFHADYNHVIGPGEPANVQHNRTIRLNVDPKVDGEALDELLYSDEFEALVARVLEDSRIEWDGSNYVGVLGSDASDAIDEIQTLLDDLETLEVWNALNWCNPEVGVRDGKHTLCGEVVTSENAEALAAQITPTPEDGVYVYELLEFVKNLADDNAD